MRLTFLTPAEESALDWQSRYALYRQALSRIGIDAAQTPWTALPALREGFATSLLAWGYDLSPARWFETLAHATTPLLNGAWLHWNTDKIYLRTIAGVAPIVPTIFVEHLNASALQEARTAFNTQTLIAKPRVGASAAGLCVCNANDPNPPVLANALLQPFLPSVMDEGELSLIFFRGALSHAVRKKPATDEIRVQAEFGGSVEPYDPSEETLSVAERALRFFTPPPDYARVDLLFDLTGAPCVAEIELIEPELFLEHAPDGGAAFARAVERAMRERSKT